MDRILLAVLIELGGLFGFAVLGAPASVLAASLLVGIALLVVLWPNERRDEPEPVPQDRSGPSIGEVIDAIGDPLVVVGDGRIVAANRAARKLLGEHIVGEDARVAIRHPAAAERLAAGGAGADPGPIELVGLGGRDTRWAMTVAPLPGRRRLVHLVDRSAGHAAERMRVDFVANASHELRTPLSAIIGYVETLDDEKAGGDVPTRKRFLKIISDEAQRMQRLVEDLMSLSRIEAEKYRLPDDSIDLGGLATEVHRVIRDNGGERAQDVVLDVDESLPFVAGDRAQLSQLLHNLINNAMKYGRPGTPVRVRIAQGPGSMVKLSVEDEGDGIAPEHLPRLTERFYRVDSSRSRALGGTGLGLAIVKHIVERHRGRLDIQSAVGRGTVVTALLPPAPIRLSSNGNAAVTGSA
jgi:two-component system phosphate regulon sensor histidine kinase PhoR